MRSPADLTGWIPFRFRAKDHQVDWCWIGKGTFSAPFFEQTIAGALRKPLNQFLARETSIDQLLAWSSARPGIPPSAFIFHGSRCGSTLLSQMAAAIQRSVVISEAPPVDHVLRADVPETTRMQWLRALLGAMGQQRSGDEQHFFVKFDSWHVLDLAVVQRAFPGVPCVFLYRDPAAVLASHGRMPGLHTVPGMMPAAVVGTDLPDAVGLNAGEYAGCVLGKFYEAAVKSAAAGRIELMNYSQLPQAGIGRVLEWCGLAGEHQARHLLEDVSGLDAKNPLFRYDPLSRPVPDQRLRDLAERFISPAYARLEAIRLGSRTVISPSR